MSIYAYEIKRKKHAQARPIGQNQSGDHFAQRNDGGFGMEGKAEGGYQKGEGRGDSSRLEGVKKLSTGQDCKGMY